MPKLVGRTQSWLCGHSGPATVPKLCHTSKRPDTRATLILASASHITVVKRVTLFSNFLISGRILVPCWQSMLHHHVGTCILPCSYAVASPNFANLLMCDSVLSSGRLGTWIIFLSMRSCTARRCVRACQNPASSTTVHG